MADILEFLKKGEQNITIVPNQNIVLVLGITASGKSTYVQYVAGDNTKLISKPVLDEKGYDTGDFTIEDISDRISKSVTSSHTVIPELVIDVTTKTMIYDCPGFVDSRGAMYDIASTYFMKKVADSAKAIKFVIMVNYSSVRKGNDIRDFKDLAKHITKMIKNVEKYKSSIALVATKVSDAKTDQQVIATIAYFLHRLIEEIRNKSPLTLLEQNTIKLAEGLLEGEGYPKINFLRQPTEAGPISEIEAMQKRKQILLKQMHENIQYTIRGEDDFGYTITADSHLHLNSLVTEINKNIASDIKHIGREILNYYKILEKQSNDIEKLHTEFKLSYDTILKTKTIIEQLTEPQKVINQVIKNFKELNITASSKYFLNIIQHNKYLQFIKAIGHQTTAKQLEWAKELTDVLEYLNNSQKWYNFLINLQKMLSTYDVQQDLPKYNEIGNDLKYKIVMNRDKKEEIFKSIKLFLDKLITHYSEQEYENIKQINLDDSKLNFLNRLLDSNLNHKLNIFCPKSQSNKLIIQGHFVKLRDINIHNEMQKCQEKINFIEIFGLNKVFVDTNINEIGEKLQISIIAPEWDIIGDHEITLDGKSGRSHYSDKAESVTGSGRDGRNGEPGLPGGNGGIFFGIGKIFNNGEHLYISASGGLGGPGQDGSDGVKGDDGTTPDNPDITGEDSEDMAKRQNLSYKCGLRGNQMVECNVFGGIGKQGGKGGDGGKGGKGGNAGKIITIALQGKPNFKTSIKQGSKGKDGKGGMGADSGKNGDNVWILTTMVFLFKSHRVEYYKNGNPTLPPGKPGIEGGNDKLMKDPEEALQLSIPSMTINNYKSYLRENLNGNIREKFLRNFLALLENNQSVTDLYDEAGLIDELESLERQFYKLYKDIPVLPFYKTLLDKINKYAEDHKNKMSQEHKKVLAYLYTTTMSKISSINNNSNDDLIIDVKDYLGHLVKDIDQLKEYEKAVERNKIKQDYKKIMEDKIREANQLIEDEVIPEINNIVKETYDNINTLINEIITRKEEYEADLKEKLIERGKLSDMLVLRKILGVVSIGSQLLAFAGPVGAGASAVLGGISMVGQNFMLDDTSVEGKDKIAPLPAAVGKSITRIGEEFKKEQQLLKEQLYDAGKELEDYLKTDPSPEIDEIKIKIQTAEKEIQQEINKAPNIDFESVKKVTKKREEIEKLLTEKKTYFEKKKAEMDIHAEKRLAKVNKVSSHLGTFEILADVYRRIKNHEAKIEEASKSIKNISNDIAKIEAYKVKIVYNTIIPLCNKMKESADTIEDALRGKSHVSLDISKWKVQSAVKDIQVQIRQLTKEFNVNENITRCIEKFESGVTAIVKVYDRMEDYHDKAVLADYIADITSSKADAIVVYNSVLRNATDSLQLTLHNNLVFGEYMKAINAFKQYIFPYAHKYLEQYQLPPNLLPENTPSNVVADIKTKITNIENNLKKEDLLIDSTQDSDVFTNEKFNSKDSQFPPFFEWTYVKNKESIKKLLEGQEITLKADITKGIDKSSIKFKEIGLYFKSEDVSAQNDLDNALKHFSIEMIHQGISYYRCGKEFYSMVHDKLIIIHSVNKNENGFYQNQNKVYSKISNNYPLISPYTTWKLKLINGSGNFDLLSKFKNKPLNLELEGQGLVIIPREGSDICNQLEKYYTSDNTVSEINNVDLQNSLSVSDIVSDTTGNTSRISREIHPDHKLDHNSNYDEQDVARPRGRRNINHNVLTTLFLTSGAHSNMRSSVINNIYGQIISCVLALKHLNPIKEISKWFTNNENNANRKSLNILDNNPEASNMDYLHIRTEQSDQTDKSRNFIDSEYHSMHTNLVNYDKLHVQGNLLLLDLLIRKNNGMKYQQRNIRTYDKIDNESAHYLAFNAHIPRDR